MAIKSALKDKAKAAVAAVETTEVDTETPTETPETTPETTETAPDPAESTPETPETAPGETSSDYTLTLEDLSAATNIPALRINAYRRQGLIPAHVQDGRRIMYGAEAVAQVEQAAAAKANKAGGGDGTPRATKPRAKATTSKRTSSVTDELGAALAAAVGGTVRKAQLEVIDRTIAFLRELRAEITAK